MKEFAVAIAIQVGLLLIFMLCPPMLVVFIILLCFGNVRDALREWFT